MPPRRDRAGNVFAHGVLSLILGNERFSGTFFPILKPEYFLAQPERLLFTNILRYVEHYGDPPGIPELALYVRRFQRFLGDEVAELAESLPDPAAIDERFYADSMLAFVKEIELTTALRESQDDVLAGNFGAVVERIEAAQAHVTRAEVLPPSWDESLPDRIRYMTSAYQEDRVPTGFASIDRNTQGGLTFGQIGLIAADYGTGKSIFLLNLARAAFFARRKVLFVTLTCELSRRDQETRFDCLVARVPIDRYADRADEIVRQVSEVRAVGGDIKFVEWQHSKTSLSDLDSIVVRLERKGWRPDLVVVDYLDHLTPRRKHKAAWDEIEDLWRDFREVAIRHRFVGWSASQLNADEQLAKAKGKAGVVDAGFKMLETPPERELGSLRVQCIKNRNGQTGFVVPMAKEGSNFGLRELDETFEQYKHRVRLDEFYEEQRSAKRNAKEKGRGGR